MAIFTFVWTEEEKDNDGYQAKLVELEGTEFEQVNACHVGEIRLYTGNDLELLRQSRLVPTE